jgi:8-oxo-dGTP diphosphatase
LSDTSSVMNYKISVLVFIRNKAGKLLMIQRAKSPNKGLWSPIGGKLEMETGESPHECAVRETFEEIGLTVETQDLRLFCMIAEKAYEGANHWLMFLFDCKKPIERIPESIDEGRFAFYSREAIDALPIPDTDREGLWAIYDEHRDGFVSARANCDPDKRLEIVVEQSIAPRTS